MKSVSKEIYHKWITDPSIVCEEVLITIDEADHTVLDHVYPMYDSNNKLCRMAYSYPPKTVLAYMRIPTMDIEAKGWHGEYTDGLEPKKDGCYLVCVEIKRYHSTSYRLAAGHWQKDRFFGCNYEGGEVIGWREYPTPFKEF